MALPDGTSKNNNRLAAENYVAREGEAGSVEKAKRKEIGKAFKRNFRYLKELKEGSGTVEVVKIPHFDFHNFQSCNISSLSANIDTSNWQVIKKKYPKHVLTFLLDCNGVHFTSVHWISDASNINEELQSSTNILPEKIFNS